MKTSLMITRHRIFQDHVTRLARRYTPACRGDAAVPNEGSGRMNEIPSPAYLTKKANLRVFNELPSKYLP